MTQSLFVTGTDTGVGKTRVAAALCRALAGRGLRVAAMKPVASGCTPTPEGLRNDDALALLAAMNVRANYSEVNPFAFAPPIAPHIAAQEAGIEIDFDCGPCAIAAGAPKSRSSRARADGSCLRWPQLRGPGGALANDVILVVGLRLGCLNHALLTVNHRTARPARGWVKMPSTAVRARQKTFRLATADSAPVSASPFRPQADFHPGAGHCGRCIAA